MKFWRNLRHSVPDSLFARIAAVLVLNLLLVQAVAVLLYRIELRHLSFDGPGLPEHLANDVQVLDSLPPQDRERVARAISRPGFVVRALPPNARPPAAAERPPRGAFEITLREGILGHLPPDLPPRAVVLRAEPNGPAGGPPRFRSRLAHVAVALRDGGWAEFVVHPGPPPPRWLPMITLAASVFLVISILSVVFARGLSRRLSRFASAAEALGRSAEAPPLPEVGPREIRLATSAFNRMQERLRRFVHDRTQMLAAISHDLRTPLTRLRLRAEFVEDEEQREKMLADIGEMEAMITSTLAFARDDATRERRQVQDLDAMLAELCQVRREAGQDVSYEATGTLPLECSPTALRRAIGNLIDNAIKYGHRARLRLVRSPGQIAIEIEDDGPGIPVEFQEQVFQPFFRVEPSRSRDTGGVGLGLSVARTILRGHGGDVSLANRPQGGLRASAILPA